MPLIDSNAIRPINRQQIQGGVDSVRRQDDGSSSNAFKPQTNVNLKTAIQDMAATLGKIGAEEKFGIEKLPQEVGEVVKNILRQSMSLEATLSKGIGSTVESQRFSADQLMLFSRMLTQVGMLIEKGYSMELSDETQMLLTNLKNAIVTQEGGENFEPVLMSKASFELVDAKTAEQLPQALYEVLAQLAQAPVNVQQPQNQSEGFQFLKQLVKFFMPRPGVDVPAEEPQTQQQGQQGQFAQARTKSPTQRFFQSMFKNFTGRFTQNQPQTAAQQIRQQVTTQQQSQQTQQPQQQSNVQQNQPQQNLQQNQPQQNLQQNQPQQNLQQNQPQQNLQQNQPQQNLQQNQPQQNLQQGQPQQNLQQNQPQQNLQQGQLQQNLQQGQPQQNLQQNQPQQNLQQNQPQQNLQQNQPQQNLQQNQPQQNLQQGQPQQNLQQGQPQQNLQQGQPQQNLQQNQPQQNLQQNQPQQNLQQNQPQQNLQQNQPQQNLQQNQPQQNLQQNQPQQNLQQNQPQQNLQQNQPQQNLQQGQPQQNNFQQRQSNAPQTQHQSGTAQFQSQTNSTHGQPRVFTGNFVERQQEMRNLMDAAKTTLLKQPLQNTPQTGDVMKNLAQFLMKNSDMTPRESAMLQNFINNTQQMMPESEARHLQNLLRLCQQNVPLTVQQAAVQQNLPDLPRLWAFMQLCDMANIPAKMTARELKRAGKDVADFATSIRHAMSSENTTVQNQKSFQMMMPLYMGDNTSSYPTYLNVFDETTHDEETGKDKKETWLRICVLTDHIGAVELVFRVFDETQLDMRFYFSRKDIAQEFSNIYVKQLKKSMGDTQLNLNEVRVGSVGERMESA
ncbi:MAG: hypothetical protein K6G55_01010 [Selenomonadaceae bacterium]|nr:hypothetical protein [Selenomonadaceae bacterium]